MTARELIVGALRLLGVKGSGDTLDSTEDSELLVVLNDLLEGWATEGLFIPFRTLDTLSWPSGTANRAIGQAGDLVTPRPLKIESAFIRVGTIDYPLELISAIEYAQIPDKSTQDMIPQYLYYDPTMTSGNIYLWPVPSQAVTLGLYSFKPLGPLTITQLLSFNPGYARALRYNLAVELAPEYGKSAPPEVVAIADDSKAALRRFNLVVPRVSFDLPVSDGCFDINRGDF